MRAHNPSSRIWAVSVTGIRYSLALAGGVILYRAIIQHVDRLLWSAAWADTITVTMILVVLALPILSELLARYLGSRGLPIAGRNLLSGLAAFGLALAPALASDALHEWNTWGRHTSMQELPPQLGVTQDDYAARYSRGADRTIQLETYFAELSEWPHEQGNPYRNPLLFQPTRPPDTQEWKAEQGAHRTIYGWIEAGWHAPMRRNPYIGTTPVDSLDRAMHSMLLESDPALAERSLWNMYFVVLREQYILDALEPTGWRLIETVVDVQPSSRSLPHELLQHISEQHRSAH